MGDPVQNTISEEQAKKDRELEALVGLDSFYQPGQNLRTSADGIAKAIVSGKASVEEVKENLIRKIASANPSVGKNQFYELLQVQAGDRLSAANIEKRRRLTEKALSVHIDNAMQKANALPDLEGMTLKGSTSRWLTYFFDKHDPKYLNENLRLIQRLYGLDENNQPTEEAAPEKLKKVRLDILKDKLNEYKVMADSFEGMEFTDEAIVENYAKLSEFGIGMGMEWQNMVSTYKAWDVELDPETVKLAKELNDKAYYLNNVILERMNYIQTPQYQFGAEQYMTDMDLMYNSPDPMFQKTVMSAATMDYAKNEDLYRSFCKSIGLDVKDVDIIYDDKGNPLPNDSAEICDALKNSRQVMVFKKGSPKPVVASLGNIMKMPPEVIQHELTPELSMQARTNRFENESIKIDHSDLLKPQKEFALEILGSEYEMQAIAASLKTAPEDMKMHYTESLKESFAKLLAKVAVSKKIENAHLDFFTMKRFISPEAIDAFKKELLGSDVFNRMFNELSAKPDGLEFTGSDELFDSLVKTQKIVNAEKSAAQKEASRIREEKAKVTLEKIQSKIKSVKGLGINEPENWGISNQDKIEVGNSTPIRDMSWDRRALPTVALALMLGDGHSVDELLKKGPEADAMRAQYADQAKKLAMEGNAKEIAEKLLDAAGKLNTYMKSHFENMRKLDPEEYLSAENKDLRSIMYACKDVFQETNTVNEYITKQSREFIKNHPTDAVPPEYMPLNPDKVDKMLGDLDSYAKIYSMCTVGVKDVVDFVERGKDVVIIGKQIGNVAVAHAQTLALNKLLEMHPEKSMTQMVNSEDFAVHFLLTTRTVVTTEGFRALQNRADKDPLFNNRLVAAMLEGNLFNDDNFKLQINEKGEFTFNVDGAKLIKEIDDRRLSNLGPAKDGNVKEVQKQKDAPEGPKGPAV